MATHEVAFDLSSHDLLTSNQRLHWREERRRSRDLRSLAQWAARQRGLPAMGSAAIVARITWPDERRRDAHNLMPTLKRLVDGLVDAGVLPDDNDKHLVGPDCRVAPDPLPRSQWLMQGVVPTTRIVLEITETAAPS